MAEDAAEHCRWKHRHLLFGRRLFAPALRTHVYPTIANLHRLDGAARLLRGSPADVTSRFHFYLPAFATASLASTTGENSGSRAAFSRDRLDAERARYPFN